MALAGIIFEDTEDGIEVQLHFDPDLPEDPTQATEAQVNALVAFQLFMRARAELDEEDSALDMPDDETVNDEIPYHPDFDDGESEEASREV